MLLGMKSRFLMILRVAEYHQFWGFQARPDMELGFLMILRVAGYHQFWGFQGYPGTKSEF